jgi:predicted nucleic acid-binding Zn ribbon protein
MSKEVVILTYCDRCNAKDRQAQSYKGINAAGATVEVDMCQPCFDETLASAIAAFDALGRSPESPKRKRHQPRGTYICPTCGNDYDTPQGITTHRRKTHGFVSQDPEAVRRREIAAAKKRALSDAAHSDHPTV